MTSSHCNLLRNYDVFLDTDNETVYVSEMKLKGHLRSLAMALFNRSHIALYLWFVVTICLYRIVTDKMPNNGVPLKSGLGSIQGN